MSGIGLLTVGVHVRPATSLAVETYEATDRRGPFVVVQVGEDGNEVTFFVREEETLNRLLDVIGEARAKLAGAITRAKHTEQGQPELPVAS